MILLSLCVSVSVCVCVCVWCEYTAFTVIEHYNDMFLHVCGFAGYYKAVEKDVCIGVLIQLGNEIVCSRRYTGKGNLIQYSKF